MKRLMKSKIFWVIAILLICVICSLINDAISPDTDTPQEAESESIQETEVETPEATEPSEESTEAVTELEIETAEQIATEAAAVEYDSLQTIFLSVSDSFTASDLMDLVSEYDLVYMEKEYTDSTTYKVAYSDDVAKQSHATDGDNLKFSFNEDGILNSAEYFNEGLFVSALYNDSSAGYEYAYTDYSTSAVLRDDGSRSGLAETNYYEAESIEDALISALSME